MTATEIFSLRRRNAPLTAIRKASEYNKSIVLDTSVYLIGTIGLSESRMLAEQVNGHQVIGLHYNIKRDLERGKEVLDDLLERVECDEGMIFPQQVLIELRYKSLMAQRLLASVSEQYEILLAAQDTSIFPPRFGIMSGLIPLCQENITSLNEVIGIVSSKISSIAYNRDAISRDRDPDVEIIFSSLQLAKEFAPWENIAFVTLDRGFKDKIQSVARKLRKKSEPSEKIFVYEIDRTLASYRVLHIHN